ncbi:MAG: HAD family hydrolase [Candidatus Omnitrophota bacterium]
MEDLRNKIKLVIFDLDGTLVDAYPAIIASFNYTMHKLHQPKRDASTIKRAVGWGDKALLRPFVEPHLLAKALVIYRRHHENSLLEKSRLLDNARDTLESLKIRGYKLAIASNRPRRFTLIIMRHLKIEKFFDFILCGDQLRKPKPAPEMLIRIMKRLKTLKQQTLYVGDMHVDVKTANRAKVKMIALLTGSSTKSELKREKPYRIVKDISYLKTILSPFEGCSTSPRLRRTIL